MLNCRQDSSRRCCDGRCEQGRDCPLAQPTPAPREVYDFCGAKPPRRGRSIFVTVLAIALVAVGVLLVLAPVSTTHAVAHWVGPR